MSEVVCMVLFAEQPLASRRRLSRFWRTAAVCCALIPLLGTNRGLAQRRQSGPVTEALIRAHMEMLASDALRGRGSGTQDEWLAATYVGAELRRLGLTPLGDAGGFVQQVATAGRLAAPPTLAVESSIFTHGNQMLTLAIGAPHGAGPLVRFRPGVPVPPGGVILVTGPDLPDAQAVAGALAVLRPETPQVRTRWQALSESTRLLPQPGRAWDVALDATAFLTLSRVSDGTEVHLDAEVTPGRTWNVLGSIPGDRRARAEEVILLSAHLDHLGVRGTAPDAIFNGADDDASGVTAVLALAEALGRGRPMRRTVVVALFGSEETGGQGARFFLEHPPMPLASIVANLEFEMIGRADPSLPSDALWLTGYERTNLGPMLAAKGMKIVADPHPDQNFFARSDNIQLAYRGIVAQTISSYGLHTDYHTPADDLSGIDFVHLTNAVKSLVEPIRWLASSAFRPEWRQGQKPVPRSSR